MTEKHIVLRAIEQRDAATLEALRIRGSWDSTGRYVGYDYHNQRWVEHTCSWGSAQFAVGAL